jgi:hypothetical protein
MVHNVATSLGLRSESILINKLSKSLMSVGSIEYPKLLEVLFPEHVGDYIRYRLLGQGPLEDL